MLLGPSCRCLSFHVADACVLDMGGCPVYDRTTTGALGLDVTERRAGRVRV